MSTKVFKQWRNVLQSMVVRHPDRRSKAEIRLLEGDPPMLYVGLDRGYDTTDPTDEKWRGPFAISTVKLSFFPGENLARKWLAAAWAGYVMHEALEMVTVGDHTTRPLDPHDEPYDTNPFNRSLRDGFPVELTPETLRKTLELVMSAEKALELTKDL